EDIPNILNAMGIAEKNETSWNRNNSTKKAGAKKSMESYYQDLPKELLCKVYWTYRMDFLLFDYEIPDFLKEFHDKRTETNIFTCRIWEKRYPNVYKVINKS
ncbi:unnamed protein product, partial [Meganyctiphanes norvegica]